MAGWGFSIRLYCERKLIERRFAKLKQINRVAAQYDTSLLPNNSPESS